MSLTVEDWWPFSKVTSALQGQNTTPDHFSSGSESYSRNIACFGEPL